ncbi:MAG: polymerase subunit delta [Candidatus Saccharibacteria bacterium]|nr:polymerase subunit delta [Candidatus Saccharibacteria bacterium]
MSGHLSYTETMITLLTGDNSFELREALQAIVAGFDGAAERVDGAGLELRQLPDLLMGGTLFAEKRLVIISDLSSNSSLWQKLPSWLPRLSDDVHLVLVEEKPDKRTVAYKALKEAAQVQEYPAWTERDQYKAEQWLEARAKGQGLKLDKKTVHHLVTRVGVDQWLLANALETLALLDEITPEAINRTIIANESENIFELFETALSGNRAALQDTLRTLEQQEDPYATFALLSSQAFSLSAVAYADNTQNPSKDFAIHPFVASKLTRHAQRLGKPAVTRIMKQFAQTDADMKVSKAEPWILIERLLFDLAS